MAKVERVMQSIRGIEGLGHIKPENCCEIIGKCPNSQEFSELSPSLSDVIIDEAGGALYYGLANQIKEKCTNLAALKDGAFTCSIRNNYLRNLRANKRDCQIRNMLNSGVKPIDMDYQFLRDSGLVSSTREPVDYHMQPNWGES